MSSDSKHTRQFKDDEKVPWSRSRSRSRSRQPRDERPPHRDSSRTSRRSSSRSSSYRGDSHHGTESKSNQKHQPLKEGTPQEEAHREVTHIDKAYRYVRRCDPVLDGIYMSFKESQNCTKLEKYMESKAVLEEILKTYKQSPIAVLEPLRKAHGNVIASLQKVVDANPKDPNQDAHRAIVDNLNRAVWNNGQLMYHIDSRIN